RTDRTCPAFVRSCPGGASRAQPGQTRTHPYKGVRMSGALFPWFWRELWLPGFSAAEPIKDRARMASQSSGKKRTEAKCAAALDHPPSASASCSWCSRPFQARETGGHAQRFCRPSCRLGLPCCCSAAGRWMGLATVNLLCSGLWFKFDVLPVPVAAVPPYQPCHQGPARQEVVTRFLSGKRRPHPARGDVLVN